MAVQWRMFNFEKLDVWQKAIVFADPVYSHTRRFPADERFGLTNQMRRAAVSISANIAAGTSQMSQTDFARFIEIATGSAFEVVSQCFIGQRQEFLSKKSFRALYSAADEIGRMLSGLRKSLVPT
jgi:four helix bundle protein